MLITRPYAAAAADKMVAFCWGCVSQPRSHLQHILQINLNLTLFLHPKLNLIVRKEILEPSEQGSVDHLFGKSEHVASLSLACSCLSQVQYELLNLTRALDPSVPPPPSAPESSPNVAGVIISAV